jgi:hypothetical protein
MLLAELPHSLEHWGVGAGTEDDQTDDAVGQLKAVIVE